MIRQVIERNFETYSRRSREIKKQLFYQLLKPETDATLLDVGGQVGNCFQDIWSYFKNTTVIDIDEHAIESIKGKYSNVTALVADACKLPFADHSIDYVFSNAVVEHIEEKLRPLFSAEISRVVRRGYFV